MDDTIVQLTHALQGIIFIRKAGARGGVENHETFQTGRHHPYLQDTAATHRLLPAPPARGARARAGRIVGGSAILFCSVLFAVQHLAGDLADIDILYGTWCFSREARSLCPPAGIVGRSR